ncbi:hypothetical protein [Lactococcus lactis]|uniref:hypothetical protein n=1 Tax=Lactococcus lactis TaxID=1358 RepID=UPI0018C67DE9|nr:hypothetical protein [Lactococcus lactis]MBG1279281.1 hypothetical protein [Lactococcus lactis subsp. lactis]
MPNAHKGAWGSLGAWQYSSVGVISSNQTGYLNTSVDYKGLFNTKASGINNDSNKGSYVAVKGTQNL